MLGLELTSSKTVVVHFNNKKIRPGETEIKIGDHSIKSSESVRFLGIIFDYNMSFSRQIENVHKRCTKAMNIIKFLSGTWWGADPSTLITFYKSFVRSFIEYGSFIYFPSQKTRIEKLEKIQCSAIRAALGYRISTPKNILLAESKLPLLKKRATYLCKCFLTRTLSNSNSQTHTALKSFYNINKKKQT